MHYLKLSAIIFLAFFIYEIESQHYTTPKNYVYYINGTQAVTWYNALLTCDARGMALATLDSQEKYDDIYNLLNSQTIKPLPRLWIGAVGIKTQFIWISTGKPILPSLWNATQPKGTSYDGICMEMFNDSGFLLNEVICHTSMGYICEDRGS